jgi:hypothetical protein
MNKTTTIVSLFLFAVTASLSAQVPQLLEHDGYLLESGKPVTGNRTMAIKIYNSATGGNASFSQTIGTVKVTNGEFYFQYGGSGITNALTANQTWLAVTVNGTEQTPRSRLVPVPFALRSSVSEDAQILKTQVGAISSNLTSVQSQNTALTSNITALSSNITSLKTQTTGIGTTVAGLTTNMTALKGQSAALGSNVTALTSNLTSLKSQTVALSSNVTNLLQIKTGPVGPTGPQGAKGDAGAAGPQGPIGLSGPAGAKGNTGATGPQGPQGLTGAAGVNGKSVLNGSAAPLSSAGNLGDFYVDTTAKLIYGPKTGSGWGTGVSLVGSQGLKGDTGNVGPKGDTGATGAMGPQGVKGDAGVTGPQGLMGLTGSQGPKGDTGEVGPQGDAGSSGLDGKTVLSGASAPLLTDGNEGDFFVETSTNKIFGPKTESGWGVGVSLVGPQGPKGDAGDVGPQGPVGVTGLAGVKGDTGDVGPQGPIGITGPQGSKGNTGDTGPAGEQGLQGPIGLTGPQGGKGDMGEVGPQGDAGSSGLDGKTVLSGASAPLLTDGNEGDFFVDTSTNKIFGPKTESGWGIGVSLVGPQGPKGDAGDVGPQGPIGVTGSAGPQGDTGSVGPQGPVGVTGPAGAKGDTGDVGIQGPIGLTGPTGATGSQGVKGDTGASGPKGDTGNTGPAGPSGSQASASSVLYKPYQAGDQTTITSSGINFQGALLENGQPVNGTRNLSMKLYDSAIGGTELYSESVGNVTLSNGVYSFEYGVSGNSNALTTESVATTNGTSTSFQKVLTASSVVAGSVSVSDGTYTWDQANGSSNDNEFGVAYSTSLRRVTATYYNGAPAAGRTITATYRTPASGISGALAGNTQPWVEISVNGTVQTPRQKVLSVPFAQNAMSALSVSDAALATPISQVESKLAELFLLVANITIKNSATQAQFVSSNSQSEIFTDQNGLYNSVTGMNTTVRSGAYDICAYIALGNSSSARSPGQQQNYIVNDLVRYIGCKVGSSSYGSISVLYNYSDNSTSTVTTDFGNSAWWGGDLRLANPNPAKKVASVRITQLTGESRSPIDGYRSLSPLVVDIALSQQMSDGVAFALASTTTPSTSNSTLKWSLLTLNNAVLKTSQSSIINLSAASQVLKIRIELTPESIGDINDGSSLNGITILKLK